MRRYLVVANQTLAADQLERKVRECLAAGPCAFSIVVPATPPKEHLTWIEGDAVGIARERLDRAIAWFRAIGADVDGTVGGTRVRCSRSGTRCASSRSMKSSSRHCRPESRGG